MPERRRSTCSSSSSQRRCLAERSDASSSRRAAEFELARAICGRVQRLRPRRHDRPPPDAPARRLLRQAAAVPAGRVRHHRPGHRPGPHGARPWRGRFRAVQGARHRPGVRGRGRRQVPRRLGVARRPGQRHQRQVQRARRADLLRPARGRRAARGARGLPAQLPAFVAVEGQGHLPLHAAMVHRDGPAAAQLALRELRRAALGQRGRRDRARRRRCANWRCRRSPTPASCRRRAATALGSMVEGRPDWVLSRQRAWGVPIALFVERKTGELLVDHEVNARIVAAVRDRRRRCVGRRQCRGLPRQTATRTITRWSPTSSTSGSTAARTHVFTLESGQLARPALARRPLPRRLRPAPRLVPVVAARKLRHPRPRAVQRGADPRLHDGRQGHENVQEPRQHRRPARR